MESLEEFAQGLIKVQLIINSDGFVYTSLQRGSTWPVYCAVWDLDCRVRHKRENAIVVAAVSGATEINDQLWKSALSRFNAFLSLSSDYPLQIRSPDGQLLQIILCVARVDLDSQAIKKLYKLQCWSGSLGCPRCTQPGIYRSRAYRWPLDRGSYLRTRSSAREAAESGTDGFQGPSVWSRMCDSTRISVDALHILWEGILDRLLKDTVRGGHSRFPILSISANHVDELSNSLSTSLFPTYYTAAWDLRDLTKKTGNEKYVTSTTILPVAVALGMLQNVSAAVLVLAICFITREMDSYVLSRSEREELKELMRVTHELFCSVVGEGAATFKSHLFFAHASEDIVVRGSPMETSTCGFEQLHGQLKLFAGSKNSRGFLRKSLERVIVLSAVLPEMKKRASRGQSLFGDLLHKVSPKAAYRVMHDSVPMANDHFRYCLRDVIERCDRFAGDPSKRELIQAEASLRNIGCETILTRILVYGKPLSSSILRRQNMTTHQWSRFPVGMESGRIPPRAPRRPLAHPYMRSSPNRSTVNRTNNRTPHEGVNTTVHSNEGQEPFRRQAQNRRSLASFLAQQNNGQPLSLVEFGQAFILDDSVTGAEELNELLSPTHTSLGQADLNELKYLHENASTADQKGVIEALIGAELLKRVKKELPAGNTAGSITGMRRHRVRVQRLADIACGYAACHATHAEAGWTA
ncbi:hypothetical protein Y032_0261g538 [Ancylostoma ceylanicum]|nr:hypothetical protein Y032_0261g538 [Ancylostoma ceylanicum]